MTWKRLWLRLLFTLMTLATLAATVGADWVDQGQQGGF